MKAFNIDPRAKVYVFASAVSMAYGFPKLTELSSKLGAGNKKGDNKDLFVFLNKKATYLKILYYHKGGYCIFAKKLEVGKFDVGSDGWISINAMEAIVNNVIVHGAKRVRKELKAA